MWPLMLLSVLKKTGAFLLTYWKEVVIGLMISTIVYQNFSHTRYVLWADTIPYLVDQNTKLVDQNTKLTADLKIAADANKQLAGDITGLNSVVGDWKAKSDELQKQNEQLQSKLDDMAVANNKKVQTILATPTPKTCEDSITFLRNIQKQLTWNSK